MGSLSLAVRCWSRLSCGWPKPRKWTRARHGLPFHQLGPCHSSHFSSPTRAQEILGVAAHQGCDNGDEPERRRPGAREITHELCQVKSGPALTSAHRSTPSYQSYAFLWETQTEDLYLEQGPAQPASSPHTLHHLSPALPPAAQVGKNNTSPFVSAAPYVTFRFFTTLDLGFFFFSVTSQCACKKMPRGQQSVASAVRRGQEPPPAYTTIPFDQ